MSHANPVDPCWQAPAEIQRCQSRPIAYVAAEAGVSRECLSKWVNRYRQSGEVGLLDRASVPHSSPSQTRPELVELIEGWRRKQKWTARDLSGIRPPRRVDVGRDGRPLVGAALERRVRSCYRIAGSLEYPVAAVRAQS